MTMPQRHNVLIGFTSLSIHPSQILSRLIQGLGSYGCPKFGVSHWRW